MFFYESQCFTIKQLLKKKKRIIQSKVNCYIKLMTFYNSTMYDFLAGNQRHLLSIKT